MNRHLQALWILVKNMAIVMHKYTWRTSSLTIWMLYIHDISLNSPQFSHSHIQVFLIISILSRNDMALHYVWVWEVFDTIFKWCLLNNTLEEKSSSELIFSVLEPSFFHDHYSKFLFRFSLKIKMLNTFLDRPMNNRLKRCFAGGILVPQDGGSVGPEAWSIFQSFINMQSNLFSNRPI